jgi:transketolase
VDYFQKNSIYIRKKVLDISYLSQMSHIGSSLSCVDILNAIYSVVDLNKIKINDLKKDRVILSKGHAVSAIYATLSLYKVMSNEDIESINKNGSVYGGHPPIGIHSIDHPTGALGHGASVGVGMAYVMKYLDKNEGKIFVVLGDGELDEGSNWEAFLQASTLKLDNIYFLIDCNCLSGIDSTDCCNLEDLEDKFNAFSMNVKRVNGHDVKKLRKVLMSQKKPGFPNAIICDTIKGKGVSFMEANNAWHYRPLNKESYQLAVKEVMTHA